MNAPTPGPWHVAQGTDERDFIVADASGNTVCEPNTDCFDFTELDPNVRTIGLAEAKANAYLMAASPDMLQGLREVAGDCYALDGVALGPRCVFCLMREGEPHDPDCTMHVVLAAIAKAEGLTA